jgi:hypothetical protein
MTKGIYVTKCECDGFMGLGTIVAILNDSVTEVAGPNEAGKTRFILGLMSTLQGAKRAGWQRPEKMLGDGMSEGTFRVELSDGSVVTLKVTPKGATLRGKDGNGKPLNQTALNKLLGPIGMDITALLKMDSKALRNVASQLAGPEYLAEVARLDEEIKTAEDERTLVNRELRNMGDVVLPDKVERVDVGELSAELQAAEAYNRIQNDLDQSKRLADRDVERAERDYTDALERADAFKEVLGIKARLADEHAFGAKRKDTDAIHAKLAEARAIDVRADEYDAAKAKLQAKSDKASTSNGLDRLVAKLRKQRVKLDKSAKIPVEGLTIGKDGIRVNGLHVDQLSKAEVIIKICVRMQLALEPTIRTLVIRSGNDLTAKSRRLLVQISREEKCNFIVEVCGIGHGGNVIRIYAGESVDASDPRWEALVLDETGFGEE